MQRPAAILALLLVAASLASAQPRPDTLWTNLYNATTDDRACAIRTLPDEGYAVAATSSQNTEGDFLLTRIGSLGQRNWVNTFGGDGDDEARGLCLSPDGGYMLFGRTLSFGAGNWDFWLVKANYYGDSIWSRTYGSSAAEWATAIAPVYNGYALAGYTAGYGARMYDMLLVRTDSAGHALWTHTYDVLGRIDEANAVAVTADTGFIIAGCTQDTTYPNLWEVYAIRTGGAGDTVWTCKVGQDFDDVANAVAAASDGGFLLAGYTMGAESGLVMDGYLVKLNSAGDTLWTRTLGGAGNQTFTAVETTPEGGFILCGYTLPTSSGNRNWWLVKTDSLGHVLWERTYDHGNDRDEAAALDHDGEGGYILAGFTAPTSVADLWVVRTGRDIVSPAGPVILHPSAFILSAAPNPFNPATELRFTLPQTARVSLKIFDTLGREVTTLAAGSYAAGEHTLTFTARDLPSGLYLARLETPTQHTTQKLILLK